RLIAEYVLADPERIISSSIADVRDGSKASVGSIVGFCRSLGLRGFAEFKLTLARELAQGGFPGTAEGSSGETGSLTQRVLDFHIRSLTETFRVNRDEKIEQVARMMEKARRIEFFSIGISYPIAYTARCKFRLIGLPASAESDSHLQVIAATQLRKNDVAFGISCSGSTRETVRCLEIAKAKGAMTVCLTNSIKSPITAFADIPLFAMPSEVKYFQAPLASRVTQLAVVDALFVAVALKHRNRTAEHLQNAGEELLKRRLT
ncbi:MAG: MurR/RpiR family transcriptional regulator, partial [Acidobacteriales bacterium]|nr:MurR/RpiR family transcriptional regulator [Terriglobales bacterium]